MANKFAKMDSSKQLTGAELHKHYADQLAIAKERLTQAQAAGNEKGVKKAQEIIHNIEISMRLQEQRSGK